MSGGVRINMKENSFYKKLGIVGLVLVFLLIVMIVEYWFLVGRHKKEERTGGNVGYQKISLRYGDSVEQVPVRCADGQYC